MSYHLQYMSMETSGYDQAYLSFCICPYDELHNSIYQPMNWLRLEKSFVHTANVHGVWGDRTCLHIDRNGIDSAMP